MVFFNGANEQKREVSTSYCASMFVAGSMPCPLSERHSAPVAAAEVPLMRGDSERPNPVPRQAAKSRVCAMARRTVWY